MASANSTRPELEEEAWDKLAGRLYYQSASFGKLDAFIALREGVCQLDEELHANWDENQIYCVDHYLGKETVQNLLAFRFSNGIFEPLWNKNNIDNIQFNVCEEVDVGDRGGFYDGSGVIRYMMQNHMFQIQPYQGIGFLFQAKVPGPTLTLQKGGMRFSYGDVFKASRYTGCEVMVYSCTHGDATLVSRSDLVTAAWKVAQPIMDYWEAARRRSFQTTSAEHGGRSQLQSCLNATDASGSGSSRQT
jgi:glucose-6-phosphate 1-dehydrogenase